MGQTGIRADTAHSYASLERLARTIRTTFSIEEDEPFPGVELFESLEDHHVTWSQHSIPLVDAVFTAGTEDAGLSWFDVRDLRLVVGLDEDTYRLLIEDDGRARFSFAHELVHVFGHTSELIRRALDPDIKLRRSARHPPYLDTEWQANAGAAAILMPAIGLRELETIGRLSVDQIQRRFGTSKQATEIRLNQYLHRRSELLR